MSETPEKPRSTEARRSVSLTRPKRTAPHEEEAIVGDASLRRQFDWRELNLASTARTLRHWHD